MSLQITKSVTICSNEFDASMRDRYNAEEPDRTFAVEHLFGGTEREPLGGNAMLTFEPIEGQLNGKALNISRAKVPGGWLVFIVHVTGVAGQGGITFVHDPSHAWNGSSLPSTET